MIADTITPIYPSKLKPINGEITVDTKTALVPITSDIESRAVALTSLIHIFLITIYYKDTSITSLK